MDKRVVGWAWAGALVCALAAAPGVRAQTSDGVTADGVPMSGFYAGIGVNANLVVPTNQTMYSQGISNVLVSGTRRTGTDERWRDGRRCPDERPLCRDRR